MLTRIKEALGLTPKTKPCGCPWPSRGGYRSVRPPDASETGEYLREVDESKPSTVVTRHLQVTMYRCHECGETFEQEGPCVGKTIRWEDGEVERTGLIAAMEDS